VGSAIRLVATDLDGTLLDPTAQITERTIRAVAAARSAGLHVVPVTGRPPQAMWHLASLAGLGPLGVCANGAVIVDLNSEQVIEVQDIGAEVAAGLVALLRQAAPGILLGLDDLECFSFERGFFELPVNWDQRVEQVDDILDVISGGCIKLVARLPGCRADELIDTLAIEVGEEAHVTTSGAWIELGAPQVSKAYALERVCDQLGVHVDEVLAVGDHHNDLPVLAWAGLAMAPANAIPEVLAVADRVLPSNADDGVAALLEELADAAGLTVIDEESVRALGVDGREVRRGA
jgi:Cof subfamily protein (haloacid dehalogenase superfamily)